jgi:ribosome recycling factor
MGDRFYKQQLEKLGTCPGYTGKSRRKKLAWTDEKKEEVIEAYVSANPTPENSMEIVKEIAEEFEESPNGVRMILTQAGKYIKKAPARKGSGNGGGRVSKAAAQESLMSAISDAGQNADEEIISKLTGKACVYLAGVISAINE